MGTLQFLSLGHVVGEPLPVASMVPGVQLVLVSMLMPHLQQAGGGARGSAACGVWLAGRGERSSARCAGQ
jgi:hypothetical protein